MVVVVVQACLAARGLVGGVGRTAGEAEEAEQVATDFRQVRDCRVVVDASW